MRRLQVDNLSLVINFRMLLSRYLYFMHRTSIFKFFDHFQRRQFRGANALFLLVRNGRYVEVNVESLLLHLNHTHTTIDDERQRGYAVPLTFHSRLAFI